MSEELLIAVLALLHVIVGVLVGIRVCRSECVAVRHEPEES